MTVDFYVYLVKTVQCSNNYSRNRSYGIETNKTFRKITFAQVIRISEEVMCFADSVLFRTSGSYNMLQNSALARDSTISGDIAITTYKWELYNEKT